jgi:hypothetical protein
MDTAQIKYRPTGLVSQKSSTVMWTIIENVVWDPKVYGVGPFVQNCVPIKDLLIQPLRARELYIASRYTESIHSWSLQCSFPCLSNRVITVVVHLDETSLRNIWNRQLPVKVLMMICFIRRCHFTDRCKMSQKSPRSDLTLFCVYRMIAFAAKWAQNAWLIALHAVSSCLISLCSYHLPVAEMSPSLCLRHWYPQMTGWAIVYKITPIRL